MSFYDNNENSWAAPGRQPSWEQQAPPSRSASGSAMSHQSDANAFASQFEEIERATDNLIKSGKWLPTPVMAVGGGPGRRDSMPAPGRPFDYGGDPRMGGGPPSRHQSVSSEFSNDRPGSAGLQGYYAGQRFPGRQPSEAEQMLQAKRRMAAQRERELRNYHQEQQYNRSESVPWNVRRESKLTWTTGGKQQAQDRSLSPATMSEEDRRELIARQHRALYGEGSSLYNADGTRAPSQDARTSSAGRGPSPLAFDPFGQAQSGADGSVQMPPRDRAESTASPVSNPPVQQFGLLNDAQQSSRTSTSSPGESPPLTGVSKGSAAGVAPIGTRPAQAPGLGKRSTTPLTPSSLSYGFNASDNRPAHAGNDQRSTSAASNPSLAKEGASGLGNWGSSSGTWGPGSKNLSVQPSVWG
ncbi:hypothetical protein CERZMDRAFT_82258 [Cercospora zeae-maydis SCOH1-5]|uniref:Uncharacterized protein n=1 Tax=Cercospora zeae-maydis SCOH1-5 TaxID=717836 RepID=A0A6A6FP25_9PEZI|nr:hypothetical protein CERZMDRAFT_82258 [Cercospora zeae-maydis SCOH1-5]